MHKILVAHPHQHLPGIRNGRRPRVRDQRDVPPLQQLPHQLLRLLHLIVLMIAGHRRMDIKMVQ